MKDLLAFYFVNDSPLSILFQLPIKLLVTESCALFGVVVTLVMLHKTRHEQIAFTRVEENIQLGNVDLNIGFYLSNVTLVLLPKSIPLGLSAVIG